MRAKGCVCKDIVYFFPVIAAVVCEARSGYSSRQKASRRVGFDFYSEAKTVTAPRIWWRWKLSRQELGERK